MVRHRLYPSVRPPAHTDGMAGLNAADIDIPQPVAVPVGRVDVAHASRPAKARPVWVHVAVDDGSERAEQGFALAWTKRHVLVQVLWPASYYKGAREFWIDAARVSRRVIDPQWLGQ